MPRKTGGKSHHRPVPVRKEKKDAVVKLTSRPTPKSTPTSISFTCHRKNCSAKKLLDWTREAEASR
jgi:hypothetical protein